MGLRCQLLRLVAVVADVATARVVLAFVVSVAAGISIVAVIATVVTASRLIAIVRVGSGIVESALVFHVLNVSR